MVDVEGEETVVVVVVVMVVVGLSSWRIQPKTWVASSIYGGITQTISIQSSLLKAKDKEWILLMV